MAQKPETGDAADALEGMTTGLQQVSRSELLKLLWDELKYRHAWLWSLFFRSSLAVLTMVTIPFVNSEVLTNTGIAGRPLVFFPAVALLLAAAATYIMRSEYLVTKRVIVTYREMLGHELGALNAHYRDNARRRVGPTIYWGFLLVAMTITTVEGYLLWVGPTNVFLGSDSACAKAEETPSVNCRIKNNPIGS